MPDFLVVVRYSDAEGEFKLTVDDEDVPPFLAQKMLEEAQTMYTNFGDEEEAEID